jgi:hypothetical protein
MPTPLAITFQDLEPSAFVEQHIREYVNEFELLAPPILRCHVTVRPHHHYWQGDLYVVAVELDLPDEVIVVGRERPAQYAHEDLRIAVRNTFAAVRSQVDNYVHGRVSHEREIAGHSVQSTVGVR